MVEVSHDDAYSFGWNAAIMEEFHEECPFCYPDLKDAYLDGFFDALKCGADSKNRM